MSTEREQREAIEHSIRVAQKRLQVLEDLEKISELSRLQKYELDMHRDLIEKGKKLLAEGRTLV